MPTAFTAIWLKTLGDRRAIIGIKEILL